MNKPYYMKNINIIKNKNAALNKEHFLKDLEQVLVRHNVDKMRFLSSDNSEIGFDRNGNFGIHNGTIELDDSFDRLKELFNQIGGER